MNQNVKEKIKNIYIDWLSTRKNKEISEIKESLKEISQSWSTYKFNNILEQMGQDGQQIKSLLTNCRKSINENTSFSKKELANYLLEETNGKDGSVVSEIGLSYYPISDRSNQMQSIIDPSDRDIIIQIRHAISGGNIAIAKELLSNAWSSLSLNDRNSLIDWVNNLAGYNISFEDYEENFVPKNKGTVLAKLEKRSDKTKQEFIDSFIITAIENMKLE